MQLPRYSVHTRSIQCKSPGTWPKVSIERRNSALISSSEKDIPVPQVRYERTIISLLNRSLGCFPLPRISCSDGFEGKWSAARTRICGNVQPQFVSPLSTGPLPIMASTATPSLIPSTTEYSSVSWISPQLPMEQSSFPDPVLLVYDTPPYLDFKGSCTLLGVPVPPNSRSGNRASAHSSTAVFSPSPPPFPLNTVPALGIPANLYCVGW